jgi:hypothetical protein
MLLLSLDMLLLLSLDFLVDLLLELLLDDFLLELLLLETNGKQTTCQTLRTSRRSRPAEFKPTNNTLNTTNI